MVGEDLEGLVGTGLSPFERLVGGDDLAHPRVDCLEVLGAEGGAVAQFEVVVEAVFDRWPDGEGGAGPEAEHRLGEHVGSRVAECLETPVGAGRDDLDRGAVGERHDQVAFFAVDNRGDGVPGEARPDVGGQVGGGRTGPQRARGAVREGDGDVSHGPRG